MNRTGTRVRPDRPVAVQSQPRVFYGWWVVAACVAMLTLVNGIGFYGLGVFLPFLEEEFGASPTLVALGTTVFFLTFGIANPYVGRRIDRIGARRVMVAGSGLFGLGMVGLALSQELWQTYVAYAVLAAGFSSTALVPVSTLISTWFHARRGLAMSVAMTGVSLGGVVMVPLATQLIVAYGWRAAALALAFLVWMVSIPLSALVVRRRPEDLGLLPDGAARPPAHTGAPGMSPVEATWSLAAARHTLAFWAVGVGYLLVYLAQLGVLIHQIRFLTYGTAAQGAISAQSAAFAISITALASLVGRLALGTVVDRLDRRRLAVGMILVQAAATAALPLVRGELVLICIVMFAFGLGMGCALMLHSLLVGNLFGTGSFGAIYGATMLVATIGTATGPWLAGFLFDRFGNYNVAFVTFAGVFLLAAGVVTLARPASHPTSSDRGRISPPVSAPGEDG